MAEHSTAVFTVVHPATLPYVVDWAQSIEWQDDQAFDLVIALDQVEDQAVPPTLTGRPGTELHCVPKGDSPAALRSSLWSELVGRYETMLFVDADDVLYPDRVASAKASLRECDLVACPLALIDAAGSDLGELFAVWPGGGMEGIANRIAWTNVFGLSNTAYRSGVLRACLPLPEDSVALDWFCATLAWAGGAKMLLQAEPHMSYRQHVANVTRVLPPFDGIDVRRASAVVRSHHRAVARRLPESASGRCFARLGEASSRVVRFCETVLADEGLLAQYVAELNRLPMERSWWACVAHPDLEDLWSQ